MTADPFEASPDHLVVMLIHPADSLKIAREVPGKG
jgi:hypothetical protein